MRPIMKALLLAGFFCLSACAHQNLNVAPPLSTAEKQLAVPFIVQEDAYCGPSALAMVLAQQNHTVAVSELADEMLLPGRGGTLQAELKASTRRQGYLAYEVRPSLSSLLREIADGRPVIVLVNLAFNWYPRWHYAVVTGYDLNRQEVIVHSGAQANQRWSFTQFDNLWQRGNRWGIVVLPPGRMPPDSAEEEPYLQAVVDLENTSGSAAVEAYRAVLHRWPTDLTALVGLGVAAYQQHDLPQAEQWFRKASTLHPTSAVAANDLAQTLLDSGDPAEAFRWAQQAVLLGGGVPARDTLHQVLHALHAE